MDLEEHYDNLYKESIKKIKVGDYQTDKIIDSSIDNRFGITLLIRPASPIKAKIQEFLNYLKSIDPNQYYYPSSDIHITVLSIISCYEGFELSRISIEDYVKVIKESISGLESFDIQFKGITGSTSCIMVQGFFENDSLNETRNRLKINFRNTNLEQSIDSRYLIQTAHATIVRFRNELLEPKEYIRLLDRFRDYDFGTFKVDSFELVYNDWYQRNKYVQHLCKFELE